MQVLIDAGAEILGYSADVSRTWSANPKTGFTPLQLTVHDIVQATQTAAMAQLLPGRFWANVRPEIRRQ